jgi:ATP-dependent 26S proteasome regulatory subunit
MTVKDEDTKEELDKVMYGYSTDINQFEEENKILKETVSRLKLELERYKQTPFMVCEFVDYVNENAMIKAPNGNQFVVGVSKDSDKLHPGDSILCEQKKSYNYQENRDNQTF